MHIYLPAITYTYIHKINACMHTYTRTFILTRACTLHYILQYALTKTVLVRNIGTTEARFTLKTDRYIQICVYLYAYVPHFHLINTCSM